MDDEQLVRDESPIFEPDGPIEASGGGVSGHHQLMSDTQMPVTSSSVQHEVKKEKEKSQTVVDAEEANDTRKRKVIDVDVDSASDDEDFDGDDMVPPHVPDDEPLPHLPIYHRDIPIVHNNCMELVRKFRDKISNSEYQDNETEYLADLFSKLMHPHHETAITQIALIGDAGHGKSSTINSLLGIDIADYGDDGDSCTCVVQEYTQASPTQTTPFMAEVSFFSRQTCVDMVKEGFAMYFLNCHIADDIDEEELEELRLNSNTALSAFMALFQDRREFRDKTSAEQFLQTASSADDLVVVGRLIGWTEDILQELLPDEENGDKTCLYAHTVASIKKMVEPFTRNVEFPSLGGTTIKCSPWPLVKKVRHSFDSRVLLQNIVLGDCPGINDKNRLRVESTRRYLQDCHITIMVNRMDRAIDHASFHNNINNAYRRGRSGSIIVVCTRSDDINMKGKQSFRNTIAEERVNARIDEDEHLVNARFEAVRADLRKTSLRGNLATRLQLQTRKARYEYKKQEIERRRLGARVSARNRHVREGVSAQYHEDTKDPAPLAMFCIANTVYMAHNAGYPKGSPPCLTLEGTEIPQMRNHIYSIPSDGKFRALYHYCHTSLETALNTVEISCSTTKLKRKEDLNKTFTRARKNLSGNVQSIAARFVENDIRIIFQMIVECESKWINRAGRKCDRWAKLKPAGHRAVMKKNGTHGTKKVEPQNWNGELFQVICADLDPPFELIHNIRCDDLSRDIAERVGDTVDRLNTALNVDPAASLSGAIGAFKKNLKERRSQIDRLCEQFKDSLKKDIRKIHTRSCTEGEDHYFTSAMEKVYVQALEAKKEPRAGSTIHTARCHVFRKLLCTHNGTFMQIYKGIQEDFGGMFQPKVNKLVSQLDKIFAQIQHDVDQVCSTNEDDSPEGKAMREELLEMLPDAREFLKEKVQNLLKRCKEMGE